MEVAPFFVDFHHFLSIFMIHCEEGEDEFDSKEWPTSACEGSACDNAYKPPTGLLHCDGEELMCVAGGGKWTLQKVCVKEQYKCDQVRHCNYGEDEANCNQEVTSWCYGKDCDKAFKAPAGGHCDGELLMCTARDGRFAGKKICVDKKFQCDNYPQCEDGKDEEMCEEKYKKKGIFKKEQRVTCKSPFLNISNATGKFFPMRAIRYNPAIIIIFIIIIFILIIVLSIITLCLYQQFSFRCDTIPQCPNGEDEEDCHIPDEARHITSLFLFIIAITLGHQK